MSKIGLLKFIDGFLGRLLVGLLPPPRLKGNPPRAERVLLLRPGGIGDAVLLVPVVKLLADRFPGALIDVLAERRNASVFEACPEISAVQLYDQGDLPSTLCRKYDLVIDTEQWHRLTAVVTRLIRCEMRIGYGTNERKKLFTHPIRYRHDQDELNSFLDLLGPLPVDTKNFHPGRFLVLPDGAVRSAKFKLGDFATEPFVALFSGASIEERRWGAARFHGLVKRLNRIGIQVVVIGGGMDAEEGREIVRDSGALNLAGQLSLMESAAVIEESVLLVSGDSGILHIGVGLDKPTVSLFGPGIAAKWAPRGPKHVVLNKNLPCSPCTRFGYTPKCPYGARCLQEISVDEVFGAVMKLWAEYGPGKVS